MNLVQILRSVFASEDINFLLTNRVPRNVLTRWLGRFSKIRHPWVARASIAVWRLFTDLDLSDAAKPQFDSLHDCFTRALRPGARAIDRAPDVMSSPSDGIVGACGPIHSDAVFQAKGMPYSLAELLGSSADARVFDGGCYVTLRLTSAMYHRFHAPHAIALQRVHYIHGDTWNVNPIALQRVERLFCRNERAVLHATLSDGGHPIALVPVAAILVASIRLHFLDVLLHLRYAGPQRIDCQASALKGQELGWFEHGSTLIVLAPRGFSLCQDIADGVRVHMGQALMRLPVGAGAGGA